MGLSEPTNTEYKSAPVIFPSKSSNFFQVAYGSSSFENDNPVAVTAVLPLPPVSMSSVILAEMNNGMSPSVKIIPSGIDRPADASSLGITEVNVFLFLETNAL
mgnify:CR=1 FL=1